MQTSHPRLRAALPALAAALLAAAAPAQWSSDPSQNLAVSDLPSEQVLPKLARTVQGDTWLGWFDLSSGSYRVRVQRLDVDGVEAFAHDGLVVSAHPQSTSLVDWDLIADSNGDCVLAFTDVRDGPDLDVHAYKIARDGTFAWGPDGVTLSSNADFEAAPQLAEASDGDLVCVWSRSPSAADGSVSMQRLSPAGAPLLAAGGVAVVTSAGEDPAFAAIVPSSGGDVVVSWVRDISTFASPRHVRARRFDATGAGVWASHVDVFDATSVPIAHTPRLEADGAGGALVVWHRSAANFFNSFVQRLDAAGNELFPHNGVAVSNVANMHHLDPALAYDPVSGDAFVFWSEQVSNQSQWGIYGQRVSSAGALLWGAGGMTFQAVDTTFKTFPRAVRLGHGAVVAWADEPGGVFGDQRLLALGLDASGASVWGAGPLVLSSVASTKSRRPMVADACGTTVVAWEDDRGGTPDLFAQNVNADGSLGPWPVTSYCTGKTNSGGCVPFLATSGLPCVTGQAPFRVAARDLVPNEAGFFLYSFKKANLSFHGGRLCVKAPITRWLPPKPATGAGPCDARIQRNFGALIQGGTDPLLTAGQSVAIQMLQRDPGDPAGFGDSLTDAVQFSIAP